MNAVTAQNPDVAREIASLQARLTALAAGVGIALPPSSVAPNALPAGSVEVDMIPARLEEILRARCATLDELAAETGLSTDVLLPRLKAEPRALNVGSVLRPVYSWLLGDEGSTDELIAKVEDLITLRPMASDEIGEITGARRNRIRGALNRIQLRHRLQNLGDRNAAIWFLLRRRR